MARSMRLALVHEVFFGPQGGDRLRRALVGAARAGAELAVLPELPLDPWVPAARQPREEDAEPPGGRRHALLSAAAAEAGVAVLGGAIVRDPETHRRFNRALLIDADGRLVATYDKLHLPREDGFWESEHYEPGDEPPRPIDACTLPVGVQLCSDVQRPAGCHLLAASGVHAILVPRATPRESYDRWLTVLRALAVTGATYVISVNRPRPEPGAPIGGPSVAIAPDGSVLVETTAPADTVEIDPAAVARARREYPGYLDVRAELYARGWSALGARR